MVFVFHLDNRVARDTLARLLVTPSPSTTTRSIRAASFARKLRKQGIKNEQKGEPDAKTIYSISKDISFLSLHRLSVRRFYCRTIAI